MKHNQQVGAHEEMGLKDLLAGRATIVRCPECGQLEIWSLWELTNHGKCRASNRHCWCEQPIITQEEEMKDFTIELECGCEMGWEMPGRWADMPYVGHYVWCERHGDTRIAAVDPDRWDYDTFTLSEHEPRQSGSPYGGWTAGDEVTVFWDANDGSWGYCFHGVSQDGLAYEADDVLGFESADAALQAATEIYVISHSKKE